jgi:hypothetical protein
LEPKEIWVKSIVFIPAVIPKKFEPSICCLAPASCPKKFELSAFVAWKPALSPKNLSYKHLLRYNQLVTQEIWTTALVAL